MSGFRECPSCAGTDISAHRHKDDFEKRRFDVSCSVCGMGVGFSEDANPWDTEAQLQARRDECVATWNRRAPDPLVGQLVEALRPLAAIPVGPEIEDDINLVIYKNAGRAVTVGDVLKARAALSAAAAAKEGRS